MSGPEDTPCGHPLKDVPFPVTLWRPGFPQIYAGLAFHWRRLCPRCESDRRV